MAHCRAEATEIAERIALAANRQDAISIIEQALLQAERRGRMPAQERSAKAK